MLQNSEAMIAVGWALAETTKQLGLYRLKAAKQGSHECRGVSLSRDCNLLGPYKPKAEKQVGHEGRRSSP